MTRQRLLQIGRLPPALEDRLGAAHDVHRLADEKDPQAFLAARGGEFTGLVTSAGNGAGAALLAQLPALKVVSSFGVGLDRLDLAEAIKAGAA